MALVAEDIIQDRYRVVRILKSGGMGSVYEAIDTKLADSLCAVKEIHDAAMKSSESGYIQTRFYEEMKALASLDHPAIPKVRDYVTQDSTIFIVMDLIQGHSLDEEVREKGPLNADMVVLDMIRLLDALDYLHGHSPPIVHRDIKPANVLRDRRSGQIKLVDFGLARETQSQNTQTVVGTMGYCAPEQLMGKAEPRSDIYSVGVTMVHLLTGTPPEMDLFDARRPELPGVRSGLVEIIEKATQPRPTDRYVSVDEMSRALQAWLHGKAPATVTRPVPVVAELPATVQLATPIPMTLGKNAKAAMVATVLLGALGAGIFMGRAKSETPVSQALAPSPVATATPAPKVAAKPKPKPAVTKPKPAAAPPPRPQPRVEAAYQPPPPPQPRPRPKPAAAPARPRPQPQPRPVYRAPVENYVRNQANREVRRHVPREFRSVVPRF